MKTIKWNALKSERLKRTRGVSFEEIIASKLIDIRKHPSRENQKILIYQHKSYLWAVPYVIEGDVIFLKTIYPSRKLMKIYKKGSRYEKD
ncbi:MAG: toxin [Candidatus Omnitrophica bacterium]|nr:toxin [Candidatus Omnitrophota bacterium]